MSLAAVTGRYDTNTKYGEWRENVHCTLHFDGGMTEGFLGFLPKVTSFLCLLFEGFWILLDELKMPLCKT